MNAQTRYAIEQMSFSDLNVLFEFCNNPYVQNHLHLDYMRLQKIASDEMKLRVSNIITQDQFFENFKNN